MKLIYTITNYYIVCDSQEQCTEVKDKLIDEGIYSITDPDFERWTLRIDELDDGGKLLRILINYEGEIYYCDQLQEEDGKLLCIRRLKE